MYLLRYIIKNCILVIEITNNISGISFLDRFRIFILGILYLFQGKEKLY